VTGRGRFASANALVALLAVACAAGRSDPQPGPGDELLWTSPDVSVMVQVTDLEPMFHSPVSDARQASWRKLRREDGALALRYEYVSLAYTMGLSWEVVVHPSVDAARAAMARAVRDLERHAARDDSEWEIVPGFYSWGDESVFALMRVKGELSGQYFYARHGATTASLSLAGIYFFEGAQFHLLVHRALSNLLFYHPGQSHE
jgi:hypothetical protein